MRMAGEGKAEEVKRESRILLGPEYLRQLEGPVPEIEPFVVNRGQKCPPALQFLADSRQQVAKPSSQPAKKRRASSRRKEPPTGIWARGSVRYPVLQRQLIGRSRVSAPENQEPGSPRECPTALRAVKTANWNRLAGSFIVTVRDRCPFFSLLSVIPSPIPRTPPAAFRIWTVLPGHAVSLSLKYTLPIGLALRTDFL